MARSFKVQGTKDFLIWAIILFGLSCWAIRDGWFPAPSTLKKHPKKSEVYAPTNGVVREILAQPGASVGMGQVVMRLEPAGTNTVLDLRTDTEKGAGEVESIQAQVGDKVASTNQVLMTIRRSDSFYPFNYSLAILGMLGAVVCLYIHFLVR